MNDAQGSSCDAVEVYSIQTRQLQNLVGRRDLTPPRWAGVSPPYRVRVVLRLPQTADDFKAIRIRRSNGVLFLVSRMYIFGHLARTEIKQPLK